jgi:cell division protein FtsW
MSSATQPALRLVAGEPEAVRANEPAKDTRVQTVAKSSFFARLVLRAKPQLSLESAGRRDGTRLALLAAGLTGFGTVMVLAASPVTSILDYGSAFSLFERQLLWVLLGWLGYALALRVDLCRVRRLARPGIYVTFTLLFAVLVPHLGKVAGGSSRWIGAGPFHLQPSELAKLCISLFCADLVARRYASKDQLREIIRPLAIILGAACILILKQPDMGTAVVVVCVAVGVLYAGGIKRRLLAGFSVLVGVGGSVLALSASYRRARLLSFINPFAHASTTGYQVVQSLVSLGSGHVAGAGATGVIAPWFLPNAETDFIYAVIGNEFGILGTVAVLLAFGAFAVVGLRVAQRTKDRFAALFVTAITCWIVLQAIVNIGGVIGALPETGIPLPFLSYGGSSLVVVLFATGLVVNIARHPRLETDKANDRARPAAARPRSPAPRQRVARVAR